MATQKYHYAPLTIGLSSRRRRLCSPEGTSLLTTRLCNIFAQAKLKIAALMLPKITVRSQPVQSEFEFKLIAQYGRVVSFTLRQLQLAPVLAGKATLEGRVRCSPPQAPADALKLRVMRTAE